MNKLFTTIVVAAAVFGMAGTSANAGIFSDVAKSVAKRADDTARQKKAAAGGQYGYFADKPYMGCNKYMGTLAKNEAERAKGYNICNKNHGYPYR